MSLSRPPSRRLLVPGVLLAGLALSGSAVGQFLSHRAAHHTSSAQLVPAALAQAVVAPSVIPAVRFIPRASRGAARAPLAVSYQLRTVAVGPTFSGLASWYGAGFQGGRTASGERFDTNDLTAASRTLPFGTRLRVCHDGSCVIVRINDRGPYVGGRVLDLSQAARNRLGAFGVAEVTATPVDTRRVAVPRPVVPVSKPAAPPVNPAPPFVVLNATKAAATDSSMPVPSALLGIGGLLTVGALVTWLRVLPTGVRS